MSTKAFRHQGPTAPLNSDGSRMLSYNSKAATTPQSNLTPQERLQDLSLTHWDKPIDEALDIHLHSRLSFANTTTADGKRTNALLASDSWTQWTLQYCKAMMSLVPLVSAEEANERLTAVMASPNREVVEGLQPWMIRAVVGDVKDVEAQDSSTSGGVGRRRGRGDRRGRMGQDPTRGHGSRGGTSRPWARDKRGGNGNRGRRGQGRRGRGDSDHTIVSYDDLQRALDTLQQPSAKS